MANESATNNVLYFPYISVPSSVWFTRMLLYWDKMGSIVPYDFIERPEWHDEHTRSLIEADLVYQVIPGMHLFRVPGIVESFLGYLESLADTMDQRRRSLVGEHFTHIHIEKMEQLGDELVKMGLARVRDHPWYDVESETADDYMCYLATALGRLPDMQFTPVTDQVRCLNSLAGRSPNRITNREIAVMRLELLEETLPAPSAALKASEIQLFKNRHGDHLTRFRRSIELELTNLASYTDPDLRETRLELIKDQMREEVADIRSKMQQHGWTKLVLGNLCGLLAAIPGMSPVLKLINAVYKAFGDTGSFDERSPLAYAAYADKDLLDRWRRRIIPWRRSDS